MPLRYQSLPIKRYTTVLIVCNAFVSLSSATTFLSLYFYYEKDYGRVMQIAVYVWLPFDIMVLLISIAVYGYFAVVRSKLKQLNAWKQLMVSTAILTSFIVLYLIPDLIMVVAGKMPMELLSSFAMMFTLNLICDAFSVTFLNRELRNDLKRTLCCSHEIFLVLGY